MFRGFCPRVGRRARIFGLDFERSIEKTYEKQYETWIKCSRYYGGNHCCGNAILTVISSKVPMKIDLTREKVYELSANTKEVMKKLDKEIDVYALYPANTGSNEYITYAEEYLDKYSALNKNFKVTFIDPEKNPGFAKKYEEQGQQISTGSIILQCGDRVKTVAFSQMYSTNDYTGSDKH